MTADASSPLGAAKEREDQLRLSHRMEAVGQLARGVAHDLNNILSGIVGYTSYLKSKLDPAGDTFRDLGMIEQSAMRAVDLTRRLVPLACHRQFKHEPISMNAIIEEVLVALRESIPSNVTVTAQLGADVPPVSGDRSQLALVIRHLCVNALEAMAERGGALTVKTQHRSLTDHERQVLIRAAGAKCVCVSVSDTGSGISPDIRDRIFEPYFTTKESNGQVGLGLPAVYGITCNHGGDVAFESAPGQGATFHLYFPAAS